MIFTYEHFRQDQNLVADVCVIGSGAGGSAAAANLAEAGKKVILLEAGSFMTPQDFTQKEEQMFPRLFYDAGGRATSNRAIRVIHGKGVGGSTLHNINLCKRLPDIMLEKWNLGELTAQRLRPYFEKVEKDLAVSQVPEDLMNENNRLFKVGVEKLGYRGGMLSHNRQGCLQSGFCELGCSYNAKMNALRVYIPALIKNGGEVYSDCRATGLEIKRRKVSAVYAEVISPKTQKKLGQIKIQAKQFIVSGGAIQTPLLLQKSQIPDPYNLVGSRLHLHPGVVAAGVYPDKVEFWQGIPQSYECDEFLSFENHDKRVWLISGSAHPIGAASLLPGYGEKHREMMQQLPYVGAIAPMVHDVTVGSVSARMGGGVNIQYNLEKADREQLAMGLREASKIHFAAGAKEVVVAQIHSKRILPRDNLSRVDFSVRDLKTDMVAVHPMSSVWMGKDPKNSCVSPTGRYHHLENLYVADTSLYPTSIGVPPQLSTYAFGHWVASACREAISSV